MEIASLPTVKKLHSKNVVSFSLIVTTAPVASTACPTIPPRSSSTLPHTFCYFLSDRKSRTYFLVLVTVMAASWS